jgi:hypothetical protein
VLVAILVLFQENAQGVVMSNAVQQVVNLHGILDKVIIEKLFAQLEARINLFGLLDAVLHLSLWVLL